MAVRLHVSQSRATRSHMASYEISWNNCWRTPSGNPAGPSHIPEVRAFLVPAWLSLWALQGWLPLTAPTVFSCLAKPCSSTEPSGTRTHGCFKLLSLWIIVHSWSLAQGAGRFRTERHLQEAFGEEEDPAWNQLGPLCSCCAASQLSDLGQIVGCCQP